MSGTQKSGNESTGYRLLFEYIKEKGSYPAKKLISDIIGLETAQYFLINGAIKSGKNDLIRLYKENRDIINFIRENEEGFGRIDFTDNNLGNIIYKLNHDKDKEKLIDLYLEKAKKLEELFVQRIEFKEFPSFLRSCCVINRTSRGEIKSLKKEYTDGIITEIGEEKTDYPEQTKINYCIKNLKTFCLESFVCNDGSPICKLQISNFDFNSHLLPTKEEVAKLEIPLQLIKK